MSFIFVACIDKAPHTVIALNCYQEYEQAMTLGYSGSGGTRIPKVVREELARLKAKALVLPSTNNKL